MARSPLDRDINNRGSNEDGLILTAIMNNDKHYLIELLVQGCSPMGDESKPEVTTPLDLSINLQNLDMVRILLRYGAWMKSTSTLCTLNPTAMHCAVLNRQKAMIRKLLDKKVDWRASDGNGATVLHMVFELDETSLLDEGAGEDEDEDEESVHQPARTAKVPKTEFSLEQEIIEIITMFLNVGANVNAEMNTGETALFLALKKGMIEVAGFLIERGANVHVRDNMGNSLIHLLINDEVDEPDLDEDLEEAEESLAQKNNATFINWLLSKGVNANYKNARGEVPLQLAIEYKLRDTLLVLLKHVNVHYVNDESESWLHVFLKMYQALNAPAAAAAATDDFADFLTLAELNDVVLDLVRRGVSVNGVDCYGQTLFHAAIQLKNPAILKSIAVGFVNVLACNSEGESVLHALVSRCIDDERRHEEAYAEVARVLTAKGANPNRKDKRGMSAVHLAAQYKYAKILRVFRDGGADLCACTDDGDSLLHIAGGKLQSSASDRDLDDAAADAALVDMAVSQGCPVDRAKPKGGWTPLHIAASSGNLQVAKSLLDRGAGLECANDDLYTPLHMAAMKPHNREMVELLARRGADVNARSRDTSTPLHLATKSAALEVIECLVKRGANVNCRSDEFASPLHLAALGHCERTLELLVRSGACLEAPDKNGLSPLHWLCNSTGVSLRVAERLMELGADVNSRDPRDRSTPLHVVVRRRQPKELLRLLARHGANLDARQASGDTPLHEAARTARIDDPAIPVLLELGARTQLKNYSQLTPLHCAVLADCSVGFYLLLKFAVGIHDIPPNIRSLIMASREMSSYMISHLAKLHSANLPTHGYHEALLYSTSTQSSTSNSTSTSAESALSLLNNDKYKREVEALRACAIDEQVSLYDLLHMQPNLRLSHLADKSFDLADLETRFPHYYGFIWRLFVESRERKLIMDPAKRALKELSNVRLPRICVQLIFNFLDNECLKNLIEATKSS